MRHFMKYVRKTPIWAFEILGAVLLLRILYEIALKEFSK
jgi:hypothetical protein